MTKVPQRTRPFLDHHPVNLTGQFSGKCPIPRREWKDMEIGYRQIINKRITVMICYFPFTREPGHNINAKGRKWYLHIYMIDKPFKLIGAIMPVHPF